MAKTKKQVPFQNEKTEWEEFYQKNFGIKVNFSTTKIPIRRFIGQKLIFIPKKLTCNKVFDAWNFPKKRFVKNLDDRLQFSVRDNTKKHYAVWVDAGGSPKVSLLGKSVKEADPDGQEGITLLERMVLELKHFTEEGKNLDAGKGTLCSGSMYKRGIGIPYTQVLSGGEVSVSWYSPESKMPCIGIRRASMEFEMELEEV